MGNVKNILHIADKFGIGGASVHGVTRLFSWWLPRFDSEKYQVGLIGLRDKDAAAENLENAGIPIRMLGRSKYDPRTLLDLIQIIRKENIDLVHLHGYGSTNFGLLAAKICRVKAIVHEHADFPSVPLHQRICDYLLAPIADRAVAVSPAVKEFMVRDRYLDKEKVEVILNGAPLSEFSPSPEAEADKERQRWGIEPEDRVVAVVGRLAPEKGCHNFLSAMRKVIKRHPKVKGVFVGDGPELQELQREVSAYGIENSILFTGYHAQVSRFQSITSIQVVPSSFEGGPIALFEAMLMGLPTVTTRVGCVSDLFQNGRETLIVPPDSPDQLAAAICDLLENPEIATRIARAGKEASQHFDIGHAVRKLEEVYDQLLTG